MYRIVYFKYGVPQRTVFYTNNFHEGLMFIRALARTLIKQVPDRFNKGIKFRLELDNEN